MNKMRFKRFGPFQYYKIKEPGKYFISAWLKGKPNSPWGWEWGSDGVEKNLDIDFRLFGLQVFGVKFWDEICFLGFWRMHI